MKKLLYAVLFLFAFFPVQNGLSQTGAYPYVTLDNKGFDSINPGNTNIRFSIPIVSRTGRGIPFNYAIQYEGLVWTPTTDTNGNPTWAYDPSWGFHGALNGSFVAGYLTYRTTGSTCPAKSLNPRQITTSRYVYHEPNGTLHSFYFQQSTDCSDNTTATGDGSTSDGSGFSLLSNGYQVKTRNGLLITPAIQAANGQQTAVSDANGNSITSDGAGNFTDTLGVVALKVVGGIQPTTFTYPVTEQANNATTAQATITYSSYTIKTNFQATGYPTEIGPLSGISLPSQITLADGSIYKFAYEPTPGFSGDVTGRLASVTLPNGGVISYAYPGCNNGGGMGPDGSPCLMQRTTSDGTKSYYHYTATTSPYKTYTVDEANNETDYQFQIAANGNAYEVHHTTYQGAPSSSSDLMEYDVYYNSDWGHSQTISTISAVDVAQAQNSQRLSHTTANLNSVGQTASFLERDNADNLLRQTANTYDTNHNLTDQLVTNGSGSMVAHTSYGYDETAVTATSNIPQHAVTSSTPGNQTSIHQWLDGSNSLTTTTAYYDTGVPVSSTSPSGKTGYAYDATQAFATQTTMPTPSSGVALSTSASYDKTSAALLSTTGYNAGQTVSVTQYDPLSRPLIITKPDGGKTTMNYFPNGGGVSVTNTMDSQRSAFQQQVYDGYGRVYRSAVSNGSGYYLTDTCYNASGQVRAVSVPYLSSTPSPSGDHCGSSTANTYTYDGLGRVKSVTHPDGKQVLSSYLIYNGAFSTLNTDELGHTKVTDTDALGRPVIACEVSSTTQANGEAPTQCNTAIGQTGFKTSYAYNLASHTTTITQGAQTRTFQTDALGRTVYTSEPERGATNYTYTYSGYELLVKRTRPQANQFDSTVLTATTTRYDTLGRPTTVTYTSNSNPSQTLQASRLYYYDGGGPSRESSYASANSKGLLSQAYLATGDTNDASTRFSYDSMGRVAGIYECATGWCSQEASRGMYRAYFYDFNGNNTLERWSVAANPQGGFYTVDLTRTFTLAGELDTMSGGVNDGAMPLAPYFYKAGTHTPLGTTSEQFGNGLYRNAIYDSNGVDAGKFVCSGTIQADCSGGGYVYGYRDTMTGPHTTHAEDTSLGLISNLGYDDLSRLSSLTSTNASFNMGWTYDRYGNRYSQTTNVSQPGSSVASYNVSTNRVASSGTPSSPNANPASYDAAGNMLSEGLHGYAYDQEGNLIAVDNNSIVNYYDALNRRVAQQNPTRFERYEYNSVGQVSEVWYNEEQYEHITRYTVNGQPLGYWNSNGNPANQKMHFQHADYLGTVRYVTGDTGTGESAFRSTPFGESYSFLGNDDDRSHFAGMEHDDIGDTDHAQFRQYSSLLGRWHSPDPYDGSYSTSDPQSFNRYNYVGNDPLSFTDPSGLQKPNMCLDTEGNCGGGGGGGGLVNLHASGDGAQGFGSNWDEFQSIVTVSSSDGDGAHSYSQQSWNAIKSEDSGNSQIGDSIYSNYDGGVGGAATTSTLVGLIMSRMAAVSTVSMPRVSLPRLSAPKRDYPASLYPAFAGCLVSTAIASVSDGEDGQAPPLFMVLLAASASIARYNLGPAKVTVPFVAATVVATVSVAANANKICTNQVYGSTGEPIARSR